LNRDSNLNGEKKDNGILAFDANAMNPDDIDERDYIKKKKRSRPRRRKFTGKIKTLITVICIAMSCYQLWAAMTIGLNPIEVRAGHVLFVLVLNFALWPATNKSPTDRLSIFDWAFVVLSIIAVSNVLIRFRTWATNGNKYSQLDYILGAITLLLVIEGARRAVGNALPIMAIILLLYGKFGHYVPGPLMHAGFSWKRLVPFLCLTSEGIYGQILGVSATYIYLFILFGAFLSVSGMTQVFNDIALALAGTSRGGPAKVSVIASGLMGSVSGSTVANVVTTGTFTIPLMKKTGYENDFAGAVEATASAGGQIMPPVMGSASFLIADSLGIPYLMVLKAALLPAILYYLSAWIVVDLRARKLGIHGLRKDELPKLKDSAQKTDEQTALCEKG
jgi:TRAP transporter 4TM/12TM fusion protein